MNKEKTLKRINIQIDNPTYEWLRLESFEQRKSMAEICREALNTLLLVKAVGNEKIIPSGELFPGELLKGKDGK